MRSPLLLLGLLIALQGAAQLDTTQLDLDLLRAPASPGSIMLGIASNDIERPSDVAAFMASLRQATGDGTALPNNFAIDIAPGMWAMPNVSASQLTSDAPVGERKMNKDAITAFQRMLFSSVVSIAIKGLNSDSSQPDPQGGFGIRIPLFPGKPDPLSRARIASVKAALKKYAERSSAALDSVVVADAPIQAWRTQVDSLVESKRRLRTEKRELEGERSRAVHDSVRFSLSQRIEELESEYQSAIQEQSRIQNLIGERQLILAIELNRDATVAREEALLAIKAAEEFRIVRIGFKCDLAGGLVLDFRDRRFDNSTLTRAGAWLTAGYDWEQNIAAYAMVRLLNNPDQVFTTEADTLARKNIGTLDLGARVLYQPANGPFSFGLEAVHRSLTTKDLGIDPTWRANLNLTYDLGNDRLLTFTIGKNYNGTTSRSGNLIAALNLVLGFGRPRSL